MTTSRVLACFVLLAVFSVIDLASLVSKRKPVKFYPLSNCTSENYLCRNRRCIEKTLYCNQINNCEDNSDESYCGGNRNIYYSCPSHYPFFRCGNRRCIPALWKCDGVKDCSDGTDEYDCKNIVEAISGVESGRRKADLWLRHQEDNKSTTNKWGSNVLRTAVALYFSSSKYFEYSKISPNSTGQSLTYEVSQRLLEAIVREEMEIDTLSSNDLAIYVNALSVSCINARDFNGIDLVARLLSEADDTLSHPSPFVLLTLCTAGHNLSTQQIEKLYSFFNSASARTDNLAFSLMALSCAADKGDLLHVPFANLTRLAAKLKRRQHVNGSFENIPTTALVLQALIASGEEGDSFINGVKYLISKQDSDGSFGSMLNTYYSMPVLQYKSLLDLDMKHCDFETNGGNKGIEDFQGKFARHVHVAYSIGIGDKFNLIHTLTLRVPINTTFFGVMKTASALDEKYKFKYVLLNSKPHIYELCGLQDDAERERYWYLFNRSQNATTTVHTSPSDVIVTENGSFLMWYRTPEHLRKAQNTTALGLE